MLIWKWMGFSGRITKCDNQTTIGSQCLSKQQRGLFMICPGKIDHHCCFNGEGKLLSFSDGVRSNLTREETYPFNKNTVRVIRVKK